MKIKKIICILSAFVVLNSVTALSVKADDLLNFSPTTNFNLNLNNKLNNQLNDLNDPMNDLLSVNNINNPQYAFLNQIPSQSPQQSGQQSNNNLKRWTGKLVSDKDSLKITNGKDSISISSSEKDISGVMNILKNNNITVDIDGTMQSGGIIASHLNMVTDPEKNIQDKINDFFKQ